jgi:hypothetical protein
MKQTALLMMLALMTATAVEAQTKTIKPNAIFKMPSVSLDEYNRLFALNEEGKLSPKEKVAFETCGIFDDLYAGFCSWYCGGEVLSIKASSCLKPTSKFNYEAKNAHDFNHESVWVEGAKGQGIGEYLVYEFAGACPRITTVKILNGHVKSEKAWRENSRVKKLRMYYKNEPYAILELEDSRTEQDFEVGVLGPHDGNAPKWTLKFEILEVYPGSKYQDTVISELWFDGIDVH